MLFKLLALSTLGFAQIKVETLTSEPVSFPIDNNLTPFSKLIDTSTSDMIVGDVNFGDPTNVKKKFVLDLSFSETFALARQCQLCEPSEHTWKPSEFGVVDPGLEMINYKFEDGKLAAQFEKVEDSFCANDLCVVPFSFWSLAQTHVQSLRADGVLGLANSADSFPQNLEETLMAKNLFSLSLDKNRKDSRFTLGGIDQSLVAQGREPKWAAVVAQEKPHWAFNIESATYGGESYQVGAAAGLSQKSYFTELPFQFFNVVTNAFFAEFPYFQRNEELGLFAKHKCPHIGDLELALEQPQGGSLTLALSSEDLLHYEDGTCTFMVRMSPDQKIRFGLSLLEKYVLLFDSGNSRVGFYERNYPADSVQEKLIKRARE